MKVYLVQYQTSMMKFYEKIVLTNKTVTYFCQIDIW